ncbi:MAG: hypothetical protein AB8B86_05385 [Pseudomonadales bacterium]
MIRNSSVLSVFAVLLFASLTVFAVVWSSISNSSEKWRSAELATQKVASPRLCGAGRYDVCEWQVRERRSNY